MLSLISRGLLVLCVGMAPLFAFAAPPALDLPREVNAFETFEVRVAGEGGSGDMLRFADAAGKVLGGSYAYVGNTKDGVLTLTAPIEPGDYAVVYLVAREIAASYPLRVLPVSAELSGAADVDMNGKLEVRFEGPRNKGDYLQFVAANGEPVRGYYTYIGAAAGDTVALRAPPTPGDYRVAYFTGRTDIGSMPVRVGGVTATLEAPEAVAAGAHFTVAWTGPDNSGDMLRVLDADGAAAGSYAYTGLNPDSASLRAPEVVGEYTVVYLTGGQVIGETSFRVTGVSARLAAPDTVPGAAYFTVGWEGPGNYGDTVQVVDPDTGDDVAYAYIDAAQGQTVNILAPRIAGNFTLQYHTHGGKVLAAQPLAVTPPPAPPGTLEVLAASKPSLGPDDAVEVVLDASGSMLQRLGDERRIEIARRTLEALVRDTIPPGTPFALRVFGHREPDSCRTDLEIPLAPLAPGQATAAISAVQAKNLARTPLADSLAQVPADLRGVRGERLVILLTDGEETCDGDPALVLANLRTAGLKVRVNIVGFAIDDAALEATFARWAELGGGEYFSATDAASLSTAIVKAVNPVFTVENADGERVAEGVAGGAVVTLAPGEYAVVARGERHPVRVVSDTRSTVSLR